MGAIFKDQTSLTLTVKTETDLTGASAQKLKYKKPDDSEGEFDATIKDAKGGILEYVFQADDLDQAGEWTFWAYVTWSGGSAAGEPFVKEVHLEGAEI